MNKTKMNAKNILVSFLTIVTALFLVATVSATCQVSGDSPDKGIACGDVFVSVDGMAITYDLIDGHLVQTGIPEVDAGETVTVKVWFTSDVYDTDVTIDAEIEGQKAHVTSTTAPFNVEGHKEGEAGIMYKKTLTIKVPYELKDELSDFASLNIEIDGKDYKTTLESIDLRIQRPSYNAAIKSVSVDQTVKAGESFPVEIVLKNIGYDNLDDLYVTARISALGIEKSGYFGDLVALECDNHDNGVDVNGDGSVDLERTCHDDSTDTVSGKLSLSVPYNVKAGTYSLEVEVKNDDTTSTKTAQIVVGNDFEKTVFKSGNSVWIVNPTDNVVGYRVIAESPASVSDSVVFVPAGASKTITVDPNAKGEYSFNVNVFSMTGELVDSIEFAGSTTAGTSDKSETNPIVILTVILAIIFIVLLIVLIVLIGKKPEKSGEFGESYY